MDCRRCIHPWKLRFLALLLSCGAASYSGCSAYAADGKLTTMTLQSSAFKHGERIPQEFTGDGANVSPPLSWSKPPKGTVSLVLICDDPDAPRGTWLHWLVYDIPASLTALPKFTPSEQAPAVLAGGKQGTNSFHKIGYGGPAPPRGKSHRYFFKLYALNANTGLKPGSSQNDVVKSMSGKIVGGAQLMGTYSR